MDKELQNEIERFEQTAKEFDLLLEENKKARNSLEKQTGYMFKVTFVVIVLGILISFYSKNLPAGVWAIAALIYLWNGRIKDDIIKSLSNHIDVSHEHSKLLTNSIVEIGKNTLINQTK